MDVVRDVDCDYVEEQNLVSGYLAGRLSDEEADALEKHFFGCEKHWREVRAGEEVRTAMRRSRAEQGTPLTASKRSHQLAIWRMFAVAAALAAVAMGALLVMRTSRTSVTPPSRTPLEELAAIATGTRTTEGRLSLELPHVGIDRGSKSLDRAALKQTVQKAKAAEPTSENARALGLAELLLGDFDDSVKTLEGACHRTYLNDARVCSDLAAAYLARSGSDYAQPGDNQRALDSAIEAVNRDGSLLSALFNRALARERVLPGSADGDWNEYLKQEKSPDWAEEANKHTPKHSSLPSWPSLRERLLEFGSKGGEQDIAQIVRAFPDRSQRLASEELLGMWAQSGDESLLEAARVVANAFYRLSTDPMLLESIAVIQKSHGERRAKLAQAHASYARGRELTDAGEYEAAIGPLGEARNAFEQVQSPFSLAAAVESIAARLNRNRMTATVAELGQISLAAQRTYPVLYARTRWLTGLAEIWRGRPAEALEAYSDAAKIYSGIGEAENAAFLDSLRAETFDEIGDARSAESHRVSALRTLASVGSPTRRYVALCSLADSAISANLPLAAGAAYEEAALAGKSAETPDIVADAFASAARAAHTRHDRAEASRLLAEAETRARAISDPGLRQRESAEVQLAQAETTSDSRQALTDFSQAEPFYKSRGDLGRLVEIQLGRADRYLELKQPQLARKQLVDGIDLLDEERRDLALNGGLLGFYQAREQLFDRAIQLAVDEGDVDAAAWTAERARARTLLEIASRSSNPHGALEEPLRPADLLRRIPAGTAIIELSLLPDRVVSFVYLGRKVALCASRVTRDLISGLVERASSSSHAARADALAQLARYVLEPALPKAMQAKRLIIVPDKELCALPFTALRQPSGRLLIEDFECAISPSATFYLRNRSRRITNGLAKENVLVVADPVPPHTLALELPPLEQARREAAELERLYPDATVLSGSAATRSRVLAAAPQATLIHFAGHALLGPGGTTPGLVLSADPADPTSSVLYASDVMSLRLSRTDLVVLGACDTARGERRGPEGVISMASAFLAAGVRTVLGTLAPADDFTTARLLYRFHRELLVTADPISALRRAQLAEIVTASRDQGQPDSWSVFQLIGG